MCVFVYVCLRVRMFACVYLCVHVCVCMLVCMQSGNTFKRTEGTAFHVALKVLS